MKYLPKYLQQHEQLHNKKQKKWISFTAFCQICTSTTTTTAITKYNLQLIEYYIKKKLYTYLLYIKTMNDIEKR